MDGFTPASPEARADDSARVSAHPAPNRNLVALKCGCREIPFPLVRVLGEHINRVLCDRHGWQELAPEPKSRKKRKPEMPGQEDMVPF